MLANIAGAADRQAEILLSVVGSFLDTIAAAGTPLGPDGTVPDMIRDNVAGRARWILLTKYPQLKIYQTKDRKDENEAALAMLKRLATRDEKVPPGDGSPANTVNLPSTGHPRLKRFRPHQEDGI